MKVDLSRVPTPQLLAIKRILTVGASAVAETEKSQLCHKSPPKGYPKEKSDYGDPTCYRYPLNTKARCLAAWRYVHHADNKSILGGKFKNIEGKIRKYAKEHYNLDLEVSESDVVDWAQVFFNYYDAETMEERAEETLLVGSNEGASTIEVEMNENDTNGDTTAQETANVVEASVVPEGTKAESVALEEKASQVEALTKELTDLKAEVETLRLFKADTEASVERAEHIKSIKSKLEEVGLDSNIEIEADYWLSMNEDTLTKTIVKMSELSKGAKASASIRVPPVNVDDSESDAKTIVASALRALKQGKG